MPAVWIDLIAKLKGGVTWINMREWFTLWFKVENEPKQDSIPVGWVLPTCQPYMLQFFPSDVSTGGGGSWSGQVWTGPQWPSDYHHVSLVEGGPMFDVWGDWGKPCGDHVWFLLRQGPGTRGHGVGPMSDVQRPEGPCIARTNASWVMVTWEYPLLYGQNDGQTWLKIAPSSNFVGRR